MAYAIKDGMEAFIAKMVIRTAHIQQANELLPTLCNVELSFLEDVTHRRIKGIYAGDYKGNRTQLMIACNILHCLGFSIRHDLSTNYYHFNVCNNYLDDIVRLSQFRATMPKQVAEACKEVTIKPITDWKEPFFRDS